MRLGGVASIFVLLLFMDLKAWEAWLVELPLICLSGTFGAFSVAQLENLGWFATLDVHRFS